MIRQKNWISGESSEPASLDKFFCRPIFLSIPNEYFGNTEPQRTRRINHQLTRSDEQAGEKSALQIDRLKLFHHHRIVIADIVQNSRQGRCGVVFAVNDKRLTDAGNFSQVTQPPAEVFGVGVS